MDKAAKAVRAAFDAAKKSLQDAQKAVTEKKEECIRKLELKCDECKSLKCKQAEDDCKDFMNAAGKWTSKALASVSDCSKGEVVFLKMAYTERGTPKGVLFNSDDDVVTNPRSRLGWNTALHSSFDSC